jgi:hypothetical protein
MGQRVPRPKYTICLIASVPPGQATVGFGDHPVDFLISCKNTCHITVKRCPRQPDIVKPAPGQAIYWLTDADIVEYAPTDEIIGQPDRDVDPFDPSAFRPGNLAGGIAQLIHPGTRQTKNDAGRHVCGLALFRFVASGCARRQPPAPPWRDTFQVFNPGIFVNTRANATRVKQRIKRNPHRSAAKYTRETIQRCAICRDPAIRERLVPAPAWPVCSGDSQEAPQPGSSIAGRKRRRPYARARMDHPQISARGIHRFDAAGNVVDNFVARNHLCTHRAAGAQKPARVQNRRPEICPRRQIPHPAMQQPA